MTGPRLLVPTGLDPAALRASRIDAPVRSRSGATMGTGWSVSYAAGPAVTADAVEGVLDQARARVIRQMSGWEPESELCMFNAAERGWRNAPRDFCLVLNRALEIAELTGGAYDPALGDVVDAHGFGPGRGQHEPIAEPRERWRDVRVDLSNHRIFQPGGAMIDLSSIAKGYAVDLCAEALRELGLASFLVEIGGEFVGQGVKPDGQPWRVTLELSEMPAAEGESVETQIALVRGAVATSGDFVRHALGATHLFDGRTGKPVMGDVSGIAVIGESAMEADAWATALFALGLRDGMATAETQGLSAVFAVRSGDGARTFLSSRAAEMAA